MPSAFDRTDAILSIQDPYMQQMVDGDKNYEFRKYLINPSVKRIWFYRTAPHSTIDFVCEISPARTRGPGDPPLQEDGLGNKEYNERHVDWDRYDFAYKILSVYQLEKPITLSEMTTLYGMKAAPQGLVYTPAVLLEKVKWQEQRKLR